MGVRTALARAASRHVHVLTVEAPGHWSTRAAVERNILARGWRLALSPADADVMAVCGSLGPGMAPVVAHLWDQLPGPRARADIHSVDAVAPALDDAVAQLLDTARQRADSRDRTRSAGQVAAAPEHHAAGHGVHGGAEHGGDGGMQHDAHGGMRHGDDGGQGGHGGMQHDGHGRMRHGGHSEMGHGGHGGMDHGGGEHGGMDHGHMDMASGGVPLAQGGEDRDGLELDVLHVRLGPVLPYWPAGLVLRCTLQGDVIVDVEADLVDAGDNPARIDVTGERSRRFAARRCDNARSVLALAGWENAASCARRVRDALLADSGDLAGPAADLDRLRRDVRRSRVLRWSLRRLGLLTAQDLARWRLPEHLRGDAWDRLLTMLDRAAAGIAGEQMPEPPSTPPVRAVAGLLWGWDLATARLIVASLDLDPLTADHAASHV